MVYVRSAVLTSLVLSLRYCIAKSVSSNHVVMIATLYDIRNPNQVAVWRKKFDAGSLPALENKRRRCTQAIQNIPLSSTVSIASEVSDIDTLQALRDENERLCIQEKINNAEKARIILGLRQDYKLAILLQVAVFSRSTFYYQC